MQQRLGGLRGRVAQDVDVVGQFEHLRQPVETKRSIVRAPEFDLEHLVAASGRGGHVAFLQMLARR